MGTIGKSPLCSTKIPIWKRLTSMPKEIEELQAEWRRSKQSSRPRQRCMPDLWRPRIQAHRITTTSDLRPDRSFFAKTRSRAAPAVIRRIETGTPANDSLETGASDGRKIRRPRSHRRRLPLPCARPFRQARRPAKTRAKLWHVRTGSWIAGRLISGHLLPHAYSAGLCEDAGKSTRPSVTSTIWRA